ncbi:esterase-like activity of phytase family protein [Sphingomonas sp. JC676]|uniref:esterase-like activity of phytase family protein n=1 Tax=Sphingomonas sp. JC676 TaxID=2768065 RepID=UPI0016580553|nr:esterase-like activity of phytase family protein [Sphingomonas sp. JC676]MBC9034764.1 esterase-like activity of phytase family protein [Sphingomonas sp. JC676]
MRFGFLKFGVLLLALIPDSSSDTLRVRLGSVPEMRTVRVPLDPSDPARTRLGALTYLGGARLVSRDRVFGGFSAMQVLGDRFTLLSDRGNIVQFRMGSDWRAREIRFADLPSGPGTGAFREDRDSESLTYDPVAGKFWVGFEQRNAIWRYDGNFLKGEGAARPPVMRDWSGSGGAESLVRLHDGRFMVISETTRPDGGHRRGERVALIFARDPTDPAGPIAVLSYVPPKGYDPSDAAELPDGRLLVVNRRITLRDLFTAKLTVVDIRGAKAGTVLRGAEIATFAAPVQHDNFEALAITRESGTTILWIASDDNNEWWQQSLLLKFRLDL